MSLNKGGDATEWSSTLEYPTHWTLLHKRTNPWGEELSISRSKNPPVLHKTAKRLVKRSDGCYRAFYLEGVHQ